MSACYAPAELSVGVESALAALAFAVRRDGYEMQADLLLTSARSGEQRAVTWHDGGWCELVSLEGDER